MGSNTSSLLERDVGQGSLDDLDEAGLLDVIREAMERLGDAALGDVAQAAVRRLGDSGLLGAVDQAIGRLAGMPLSGGIDDTALAGSVATLARLEAKVAAEKLRRLAEVDRRKAYRAAGHGSSEELLAANKTLTKAEARAQAQAARALAALPRTAAKLASGELGTGQAEVAARALGQLPAELEPADRDDVVDELDELVADRAGREDRRLLGETVQRWQHAIDERLVEDREKRAWQRRSGSKFTDRDGSTIYRLRLDPVGAAKVGAVVEPLARRDGPEDKRTREQRVADAFVKMAELLADAGGLPEVAAQRPHVVMVTNRSAMDGVPGAEPSSLDGVGIVSSATARMIACDGQVTEVVVDDRGMPLVVKEPSKPTRKQRLAVIARDRGCVGCRASVARCELHHIRWRRHAGSTVVDNLVLVCWGCHRNIHHHGFQVVRQAGRWRLEEPSMQRPVAAPTLPPRRAREEHRQPA
ncbi:MAG TPA: DUF222 domain-containing protein [Egibacteraceae bacterium]|nr:DUF222 domain-containing protein [Egibacteraceae bacterium]